MADHSRGILSTLLAELWTLDLETNSTIARTRPIWPASARLSPLHPPLKRCPVLRRCRSDQI